MNITIKKLTEIHEVLKTEVNIMVIRRCNVVPLASARFSQKTEAAMAPVERSEAVCPSGLSAQLTGGEPTIIIFVSQNRIL